jgi:hypothetical protein
MDAEQIWSRVDDAGNEYIVEVEGRWSTLPRYREADDVGAWGDWSTWYANSGANGAPGAGDRARADMTATLTRMGYRRVDGKEGNSPWQ